MKRGFWRLPASVSRDFPRGTAAAVPAQNQAQCCANNQSTEGCPCCPPPGLRGHSPVVAASAAAAVSDDHATQAPPALPAPLLRCQCVSHHVGRRPGFMRGRVAIRAGCRLAAGCAVPPAEAARRQVWDCIYTSRRCLETRCKRERCVRSTCEETLP